MICLSPEEVERRFAILGIPNRFTGSEKQALSTTSLGEHEGRIFVFPTPVAKTGLNILKLREIVGTNPAKQPSFFDHPWYLEEAFGRLDCEPGWQRSTWTSFRTQFRSPSTIRVVCELPTAVEVILMLFLHYRYGRTATAQEAHLDERLPPAHTVRDGRSLRQERRLHKRTSAVIHGSGTWNLRKNAVRDVFMRRRGGIYD